MTRRRVAAAAIAVLLLPALAACSTAPSAPSCVSWVDFPDAQKMYEEAVLVVAGTADAADGTVELFSGPGDRHRVTIDEVYKGDFAGEELWAASPRDYCTENPPSPAEDPIPTGERVVLFLRPASTDATDTGTPSDLASVAAWRTLTPIAGVLPFSEGAEPPFDTEG
ncbi:MAG: hypothetical protein DI534_02155 [Leifsonia xyli]|nr:MAG: hypothetical protein DI534_02155 [Leifsonia xyli]